MLGEEVEEMLGVEEAGIFCNVFFVCKRGAADFFAFWWWFFFLSPSL